MPSVARVEPAKSHGVGDLLRHWRTVRAMSQLDLSIRAGVSTRHLSFVESGRARASRDMLHLLADALDVPLRERNALLTAAGFAEAYRESTLEDADLASVRRALDAMLQRLDPYPCVVLDRHWNVTLSNSGALRMLGAVLTPDELMRIQPLNVARMLFHPVMRPHVAHWDQTAGALMQRLHREALSGDPISKALVEEIVAMPDVPRTFHTADLDRLAMPFIPVELARGPHRFRFFTTLTTLGTPLDVTLQELRIETYFPADDATDRALRALPSG